MAARRSSSVQALPAVRSLLPWAGSMFPSLYSTSTELAQPAQLLGPPIRERAVEPVAPAPASQAPVRWIRSPQPQPDPSQPIAQAGAGVGIRPHRPDVPTTGELLARESIERALHAPLAGRAAVLDQALASLSEAVSEGRLTLRMATDAIILGWQRAAGAHGAPLTDFTDILAAMRRVGSPDAWFVSMLSVRDQESRASVAAWCGDKVRQAWFAASRLRRIDSLAGDAPLTPATLREIVADACRWRERPLGETIAHIVTQLRIGLAHRSGAGNATRADTLDQRTQGALLDGLLDFAASEGVDVGARELKVKARARDAVGHLASQLRLELHSHGEIDNFLGALSARRSAIGHGECVAMASLLDELREKADSDRKHTLAQARLNRRAKAMAAANLEQRARNESAALLNLRTVHRLHQPPAPDRAFSATLSALRMSLPAAASAADPLHEAVALVSKRWDEFSMWRAGVAAAAHEQGAASPQIDRKHVAGAEPALVRITAPALRPALPEEPVPPAESALPVPPDAVPYVRLRSLPNCADMVRLYDRYPDADSPWQKCADRLVSPAILPMRDWPAADRPDQPERSWHEDLAWCVRLALATPDRPVGGAMLFNLIGELSNNLTLHKGGDPRLDDSMVDVLAVELFKVSMAAPPAQQAARAAQRMSSLMDALFPPRPSVEMLAHGLELLLDALRRVRDKHAISPACLAAMMAEVVRRTGGAEVPAEVLRLVLQPLFWDGLGKDGPHQVLHAVADALRCAVPGAPAQARFFGALLDCYQDLELEGGAREQGFERLLDALEASTTRLNPPPVAGDTNGCTAATLAAVRQSVTLQLLRLRHREPDHLGRILRHWVQVCERLGESNARVMRAYAPATQATTAASALGQAVDPMPRIVEATLDRLFTPDHVERFGITRTPVPNGPWRGWSSAADFEAALALPALLELVERSPQCGPLMVDVRQRFGKAIPGLPVDRVQELAMTWSGAQLQAKVPPAEVLNDLLRLLRPEREAPAPADPLDAPRTAALARGFMRAWVSRGDSQPTDARQEDGRALLADLAPDLARMPPWRAAAVALGIRGVAPRAGPGGSPKDARLWEWLAWASVDLSDPQLLEAALHDVIDPAMPAPARNKRALVAMLTRDRLMDLTDRAFDAVLKFILSQSLEPTPAKGQARLLAFCRNLRDHTGLGFVRDGKAGDVPLWVLEENEDRMKRAFGRVQQVLAALKPSQASRELVDFSRRLEDALEQVPPPPPPIENERPGEAAAASALLARRLDFGPAGRDEREEPERKHSEGKASPGALRAHTLTALPVSREDESAAAYFDRIQREQAAALRRPNPTVSAQSSSSSTSTS